MMKTATCLGLAAALLLLGPGCGGSSPSTAQAQAAAGTAPLDPANSGTLTVHLVQDGQPGALSHLNLALAALELRVGGVWRPVTLEAPGQDIDILSATSQTPALLALNVPWPTGLIDEMRFSAGPNSKVQLSDEEAETFHNLAVPGQFVSGMGLPGSLSVPAQGSTDLWIAFGVSHVILPDTVNDGGYTFIQGPIRGYDKAATGTISGTLTSQEVAGPPDVPAAPLAGASVTAQLLLEDGQPGAAIAFRTVQTDVLGHYSLDLLPKGYTWSVVSQPVVGQKIYYPQASPGFAMGGAPFDQYQSSMGFALDAIPGSVSGLVAHGPGVGQEDVVDLIQEIPVDGVPYRFVLGSAVVADTGAEGHFTFGFSEVPPGIYSAVFNNYTQSLKQGLVDQTLPTAGFVVSAGSRTGISF